MDFSLLLPLLLGWLAGWLVNYLADVLPLTRTLSQPVCTECGKPLGWRAYLLFGNCSSCGRRPSARRLIVQGVMTVAPVLIWLFPRPGFPFALAFPLMVYLTLVMVIDLEHRLILHPVSIAGAVLGLGTGIYLQRSVVSVLIGGAAGFGIMLVLYYLGELYVRQMKKRRGISTDEVALGFGDVNLSGILGLLVGWPAILVCLFFAVLAGGLVSLVIILGMVASKKYKAFTAIPYAPFLILSAIYILYFVR